MARRALTPCRRFHSVFLFFLSASKAAFSASEGPGDDESFPELPGLDIAGIAIVRHRIDDVTRDAVSTCLDFESISKGRQKIGM
jgi:hypothetical protein